MSLPGKTEGTGSRRKALVIGAISFFIALFLIVYQPFGTQTFHHPYKFTLLVGYGILFFLVFSFGELLIPRLFPTLYKQVKKGYVYFGWITCFSVLYVVLAYFYSRWFQGYEITFVGFLKFSGYAFLVGVFPIAGLIILSFLKKNTREIDDSMITIRGIGRKEKIRLKKSDVLVIRASSNYAEIFFIHDKEVRSKIIRNTMGTIEKQLLTKEFIRCHRSYVINRSKIRFIEGTSPNYRIILDGYPEEIPVARDKGKLMSRAFLEEDN